MQDSRNRKAHAPRQRKPNSQQKREEEQDGKAKHAGDSEPESRQPGLSSDFSQQTFDQHATLLSGSESSQTVDQQQKAALLRQLQQSYGNAYVQRLVDHVQQTGESGNTVQRNGLDAPVTGIDVDALKRFLQSQREEIQSIRRGGKIDRSQDDYLEICDRRLSALYVRLGESDDPMKEWDDFIEWADTTVYSKGGMEAWETYQELSALNAPPPVEEKGEEEKQWSAECDSVWQDMEAQFSAWDGSTRNRGAWWGSSRPGSTSGAKSVPTDVVKELRKRSGGTPWRFSDSFSGGISFHRTRGKVDFIYHMLAP